VLRGVAAAVALLAACGRPATPAPAELRVAGVAAPEPLHPDGYSTLARAAGGLVYEPPCRWDPVAGLVPAAARACTRVGPGHYLLEPDPGRRFSDGSPVTAADLARAVASRGLLARVTDGVVDVRAPGGSVPVEAFLPHALVWREGSPFPLGSGPFVPEPAAEGRMELRRRDPAPGRVERVLLEALPDSREALARALRQEADVVVGLDGRQWEMLEDVPGLSVVHGSSPHAVALVFNTVRLGPVERRALAASLPRGEIAAAYGGSCRPDRPQPVRALDAGPPLDVLVVPGDPGLWRAGLALRRALGSRAGELRLVSPSREDAWRDRAAWDVLVTPLMRPSSPAAAMHLHSGAADNLPGWSNPAADAAMEAGDPRALADAMDRDPPAVMLCGRERTIAVTSRVRNPSVGWWRVLDGLPDWELGR
jgi:hypothetical protein